MIHSQNIEEFQKKFDGLDAETILHEAFKLFENDQIAFASSLAAEDQVLTAMVVRLNPKAHIFTIDTGRLPQETYDVIQSTMSKYGFQYEVLFPDYKDVEEMVSIHGPNLFYENRDKRTLCCHERKVKPLKRKLATLKAWICGLRREQAVTRSEIQKIEWDEGNGLVKINPLADWKSDDVWNYIRKNGVPYNKLHDKGYSSIGCSPCTRPIQLGEDVRAGRWWWEDPEHKECGLHVKKTKKS